MSTTSLITAFKGAGKGGARKGTGAVGHGGGTTFLRGVKSKWGEGKTIPPAINVPCVRVKIR